MAAEPWIEALLPLHAATFEMRFTEACTPGFFHQAALTAWLRRLLDSPDDYDLHLTLDAPEQGRRHYRAGEHYRFTLFAGGEQGHAWLAHLAAMLSGGTPALRWDAAMPFRNNWRLAGMYGWPHGEPLSPGQPVPAWDAEALAAEVAHLRALDTVSLSIRSPWRILKAKGQGRSPRGEMRFCRDAVHLHGDDQPLWLMRIGDALRDLARRRGAEVPPRGEISAPSATADVFWVDAAYQGRDGSRKPMGGVMGAISGIRPEALSDNDLAMLVLGQYLGIGQRRAFGYGRYRLLDEEGRSFVSDRGSPGLLDRAMREENLKQAWQAMAEPEEEGALEEGQADPALDDDHAPLLPLARKLLAGRYEPPALIGFVHEDADGGLRPLAAPPLHDRALQRAVHQELAPMLDGLMSEGSYGYRAGRSRYQVRDQIQRLYREGYRWVFESDIRSFFDTVAWPRLEVRLRAVLGDDPAIDPIMRWMRAPVRWKKALIEREAGLPQGSPLSPVLANLMLDDFDHDLADAGCRLIRFADDFIIIAKSREAAEAGGVLAREALRDTGLDLNEEKTRIVPFSEGFRFLGFMFVDGLAVESKPPKSREAGKAPAHSWLARAEAAVEGEGRELCLRGEEPVPLAAWQERNRLLIFCGEPALIYSRGGRLCIEREDVCLHESPWSHLDAVVLFGRHQITTPALHEAMKREVPVHMATAFGDYIGVATSARAGIDQAELWQAQWQRLKDEEWALAAAKSLVEARIRHMGELLRRRQGLDAQIWKPSLDRALRGVPLAEGREELNGIEGSATRAYFAALAHLVPAEFGFEGRKRRPPPDPFNALLSLGYTQLYAHADALLRADGLQPVYGIYHQPHGAHAALASDLMEPFRHVVEREALKMVQGRLKPEDFTLGEEGCRLSAAARRLYLGTLSEALLQPVKAHGGGEPCAILEHMHRQNLALKFVLAGKAPAFQAWRMR